MIQSEIIAKELLEMMYQYNNKLNEPLFIIQEKCSNEEFNLSRRSIGKVMGEMWFEIIKPIYDLHPNLIPETLRKYK